MSAICSLFDIHQLGGRGVSVFVLKLQFISLFWSLCGPVAYCNLGHSHSQLPTWQPSFKLHHPADTSLQLQEAHVALRSVFVRIEATHTRYTCVTVHCDATEDHGAEFT